MIRGRNDMIGFGAAAAPPVAAWACALAMKKSMDAPETSWVRNPARRLRGETLRQKAADYATAPGDSRIALQNQRDPRPGRRSACAKQGEPRRADPRHVANPPLCG